MRRRQHLRKHRRCRDCPFWAPPARCLDPAIKSGWCGDWVWYMRGRKQCRRRYARPRDPETLEQMRSRGRFGAASGNYSKWLTDEQHEACIAAGAKIRSRTRLGQSGPLTGQQYWIRKDYERQKTLSKATKLKTTPQVLQPQRVVRSTSGPHRHRAGVSPEQRRRTSRITPSRVGRHPLTSPVSKRASVLARLHMPKFGRSLGSRGARAGHRKVIWRRQRGLAGRR